ncbi:hypothetical protein OW763_15635 [Clostridium aestuarii]|uniref:Uncharacterized protein n=1 Tax=Clostridium aestuarii TaxID=338193 RepID=A0ABT4D3F1_9CLOT|nr:hypothetical protein [Clostridium aestuarii]MCY6485756.1 hypothetical protein [Clostridium aestuarii]
MGKNINNIIYTVLSLVEIVVLGFSLMIYTSLNKSLPWYDGCGMQFLVILIISVPLLLVIGVGLKILSKKYNIRRLNIKIPFLASISIAAPILLDGSLNRVLIAIGGCMCTVFIIITIYLVIVHFKSIDNKLEE